MQSFSLRYCPLILILISFVLAPVAPRAWAVITIDTVPVGNARNPSDQLYLTNNQNNELFGSVEYEFRIGKHEVTVGQYTSFLNAVAATDTYALYHTQMATRDSIAGIARSGSPGTYTYSVIGSPNKPIAMVSWGDAARFANWMHNNQPTGPQGPGTTEAGAYTLNGATSNAALSTVLRNFGAKWFIPTENEWYKAAYYQPTAQGGDSDSYWLYPMRTNSTPFSDQPPGDTLDNTRVGNFQGEDGSFAVTGSTTFSSTQNYLTDVGAYDLSSSFYGTFDQGGNVTEWTEAPIGDLRVLRGGQWGFPSSFTAAEWRSVVFASSESFSYGFRVATIPEPSTLALAGIGALAMLACGVRHRFVG